MKLLLTALPLAAVCVVLHRVHCAVAARDYGAADTAVYSADDDSGDLPAGDEMYALFEERGVDDGDAVGDQEQYEIYSAESLVERDDAAGEQEDLPLFDMRDSANGDDSDNNLEADQDANGASDVDMDADELLLNAKLDIEQEVFDFMPEEEDEEDSRDSAWQ